jgi:hypothetical protein
MDACGSNPRSIVRIGLVFSVYALFVTLSAIRKGDKAQADLEKENILTRAKARVAHAEKKAGDGRPQIELKTEDPEARKKLKETEAKLKVAEEKIASLDPRRRSIVSANATVTLFAIDKAHQGKNTKLIGQGGFAAFAKGTNALLAVATSDLTIVDRDTNTVSWIAEMSGGDEGIGKPIQSLLESDRVEIFFHTIDTNVIVIGGKVDFILNSAVRIEFDIPPQRAKENRIFVRNILGPLKKGLE